MKKSRWLKSLVLLVCVFAIPLIGSAKTYKIRFSIQNPEMAWGSQNAYIPWKTKIEKASKGQIKFQDYYSQTLAKGPETWNAVKNGIAELGWCFHAYWPGMTPLADVISLPSLPFKTSEQASVALQKLYDKFPSMRKQFEDNHVLFLYTTDPYFLITTKKQVTSVDDIQGLKIRMMGGPSTEMMKALGGVPVSIPMPDNYISLQKGVTDGMGASWEPIIAFRLYEVAKYYTLDTHFPVIYFSLAMNNKTWDRLPNDLKEVINDVSGVEGSRFWGHNFFDTAKTATIEKALSEGQEMHFVTLSENEQKKWMELSKPIWDNWVNKTKAAGHPEAREVLDYLLDMF